MSDAPEAPARITISSRFVLIVLFAMLAVLVIAYIIEGIWTVAQPDSEWTKTWITGIIQIWNLNEEVSLSRWYEEALFLIAAALLFYTAAILRHAADRAWKWWVGLGILFVFLSADEAAQFHEVLVVPMQRLLNVSSGPFAAGWIYPMVALVIVLAVIYGRFYFRLARATKLRLAIALIVFLVGAVGFEIFAWSLGTVIIVDDYWTVSFVSVLFEESLEMTGLVLFIYALLRHLRDHVVSGGMSVVAIR